MKRKLVVALSITIFVLAARAHAATPIITFKQPPATDDERAIAQVMETLAAKMTSDARGASELYTQDAVIRWFFGSQSRRRLTEGRESIYFFYSSTAIQSVELTNITIRVTGEHAEANGHVSLGTSRRFGRKGLMSFLREEERTWRLRREPEGWRIYYSDAQNSAERMR